MPPLLEPGLGSSTDEALVARLADGDADALRMLYRRYASLVFTIAARVLDEAAAEDVVQDVFVVVWKRHHSFTAERGSFKSWIAQIARRRTLNELRRRQRRGAENDSELEVLPDDSMKPDEAQWAAHRRAVLARALAELPPRERQAVSLAFLDELSHSEVASALNAPLGTAKTRIRRALARLAPLAAVIAIVALLIHARRSEDLRDRDERALRDVTASDVVPLRLVAAPGVAAEAHGNYRARPGHALAVVTTTALPQPSAGEKYVAWARHGSQWTPLGPVQPEADGHSLLVAEEPSLATRPDELRVTRESQLTHEPRGPVVLKWSPNP